jgi:hypothetical protein
MFKYSICNIQCSSVVIYARGLFYAPWFVSHEPATVVHSATQANPFKNTILPLFVLASYWLFCRQEGKMIRLLDHANNHSTRFTQSNFIMQPV